MAAVVGEKWVCGWREMRAAARNSEEESRNRLVVDVGCGCGLVEGEEGIGERAEVISRWVDGGDW
jgi:hypothetical protein